MDANASRPATPVAQEAYARATRAVSDAADPQERLQIGRDIVGAARARIAQTLGVAPEEIIFTSGGTEAAAWAVAGAMHTQPEGHLVTSALEHPAVTRTAEMLAQDGYGWTRVVCGRDGRMDAQAMIDAVVPHTRLISLMTAGNETGVLQPVAELAGWCREHGILCHTDAVQAMARIETPWRAWQVDLASWAGHKIGAVGAIGCLYVRQGVVLQPPWLPWNDSPTDLVALEDPDISAASAAAMAAALPQHPTRAQAAIAARRDRFEHQLKGRLPEVEVIGGAVPRLPNTSCVRFPGCEADGLMMALDLQGVYCSTGSACASGSIEPSAALLGMGYSAREARETLRFSLDEDVTDDDLTRLLDLLDGLVLKSRR